MAGSTIDDALDLLERLYKDDLRAQLTALLLEGDVDDLISSHSTTSARTWTPGAPRSGRSWSALRRTPPGSGPAADD